MLAILAGCALPELTPPTVREAEYNDRFIMDKRVCEAKGGMIVVQWEPGTRPMQGPHDIPEPGTRYSCVRR